MVQSDHAPIWTFIYSVIKNDKVNNWSQEMHAITPHIEFEHSKRKNNVLADSLSRLRCLGIHDDNDPERLGQEYGKSIFKTDENIIHSLDDVQNSTDKFKINRQQYILDKNEADNTHASTTIIDSLPHTCN